MTHDVKCPLCGKENKNLLLEETGGWFVCERCDNEILLPQYSKTIRVPLYDSKKLARAYSNK